MHVLRLLLSGLCTSRSSANGYSYLSTILPSIHYVFFFFFNDTATTEIYTLSLHDALPISDQPVLHRFFHPDELVTLGFPRSEEHTSELQSRPHLVCRLLLEKKNSQPPPTRCDHPCVVSLCCRSMQISTPRSAATVDIRVPI